MFGETGRRAFLVNFELFDDIPIFCNLSLILVLPLRPIAFLLVHLGRHLRLPLSYPLRREFLTPGFLLP